MVFVEPTASCETNNDRNTHKVHTVVQLPVQYTAVQLPVQYTATAPRELTHHTIIVQAAVRLCMYCTGSCTAVYVLYRQLYGCVLYRQMYSCVLYRQLYSCVYNTQLYNFMYNTQLYSCMHNTQLYSCLYTTQLCSCLYNNRIMRQFSRRSSLKTEFKNILSGVSYQTIQVVVKV